MSRPFFKTVCVVFAVVAGGGNLCKASYAPTRHEVVSMHKTVFRDRKPEEIARFLAHPDENTHRAVVAALADNPETAMPLVEKLIDDTNPWVRAGAVDVLVEIVKHAEKEKNHQASAIHSKEGVEAYRKAKAQDTEAETRAFKLITEHLSEESSAPVLFSVCQLFKAAPFEESQMRPFLDRAARSDHPATRHAALYKFRRYQKNKDGLIRTALLVMKNSDCSINQEMLAVASILSRGKKSDAARAAIPVFASHLLHKANSADPPFRKAVWYNVVNSEIDMLETHWDEEVEQMPDVVPALCRAVVRLPYSEGRYTTLRLRERARALLERCGPQSAATVRDCAEKESVWLENVSDHDLQLVTTALSKTQLAPGHLRQECRESIKYLSDLADRIEAGNN